MKRVEVTHKRRGGGGKQKLCLKMFYWPLPPCWQVQAGDKADVDKAVAAARLAMKRNSVWRTMAPAERGRMLMKIADIIERDIVKIASLEVIDNGKPFSAAVGDIKVGVACLRLLLCQNFLLLISPIKAIIGAMLVFSVRFLH